MRYNRKFKKNMLPVGPYQQIEFEMESISLDVPSKEEFLGGGWKIVPLIHPAVRALLTVVSTC